MAQTKVRVLRFYGSKRILLSLSCLAIVALSSCVGHDVTGTGVIAPTNGSTKSMGKTIDWFSCTSSDGGDSWSCIYTGSQEYAADYWIPDRGELQTTSNCTFVHSVYCDQTLRSGPYAGPFGSEAPNETQADEAALLSAPPNCSSPTDAKIKAYCVSSVPDSTQKARIKAALADMNAIGGVCAALSAIGSRLLANGTIHVFTQSAFPAFSGAAPVNGSNWHPEINEWIVVSNYFTNAAYDYVHRTSVGKDQYGPRTLQQVLAHELDHLNNAQHLSTDISKTPNSQLCSRLP